MKIFRIIISVFCVFFGSCQSINDPQSKEESLAGKQIATADTAGISPETLKKYRIDAHKLVLQTKNISWMEEQIDIPAEEVDVMFNVLVHLHNARWIPQRDTVIDTFAVHASFVPVTQSFDIQCDTSLPWMNNWRNNIPTTNVPAIDSLIDKYGLNVESERYTINQTVNCVFSASGQINIRAMQNKFLQIPGISTEHRTPITSTRYANTPSVLSRSIQLMYDVLENLEHGTEPPPPPGTMSERSRRREEILKSGRRYLSFNIDYEGNVAFFDSLPNTR